MGVVVRQSLKGTFVNYIGVVLGIFVQFYIVAKYLDPEVIGLSKVVYEVAFLLSTLALFGSGSTGMRFFPYFKDEKTGNHGFLYYYLLFPITGVITITLLYLALRVPIESYFGAKSPLFNQHFYYVIPMLIVLAFWVWAENYAIHRLLRHLYGFRLRLFVEHRKPNAQTRLEFHYARFTQQGAQVCRFPDVGYHQRKYHPADGYIHAGRSEGSL